MTKPWYKSRTIWLETAKGAATIVIGAGLAQVWLEPEWAATTVVGLRVLEHWASLVLRFETIQPITRPKLMGGGQ